MAERPAPSADRDENPPSGLVLFPPGTPAAVRSRRWLFLAVFLAVAACLQWPIFPRFSAVRPLMLGLPLSFAWVILQLTIVFIALVWLFRHDEGNAQPSEPATGE